MKTLLKETMNKEGKKHQAQNGDVREIYKILAKALINPTRPGQVFRDEFTAYVEQVFKKTYGMSSTVTFVIDFDGMSNSELLRKHEVIECKMKKKSAILLPKRKSLKKKAGG